MKLSLVFFIISLLTLLSHADQTDNEVESDSNSCLTSRRLLFFGGLTNPLGEKKSQPASSSSKASSSSSPPKYARADVSHGLTVYIRPQTSSELGHKVRSYSHLLKSKLFTKEERTKLKKSKKSKTENKKKDTTQVAPKTQGLVAINDQERDRCRALLQIDHQNGLVPTTPKKQIKKVKNSIATKVKNATAKAKKQVAKVAAKTSSIKEKSSKTDKKDKEKVKPIKNKTNLKSERKDKPTSSSETTALTPPTPVVKQVPTKKPTVTTTTSPPPPPPQPTTSSKPKREKQAPPPPPPPIAEPADSLDTNEQDEIDNEDQKNSVVNRAYSFVKNMFQLSDDILENNHTFTGDEEEELDTIFSSPTEQSNRPSRKLLSFIDSNDLPFSFERIFKRRLLSVKTNKQSISSKSSIKKGKTTNQPDGKKPKVGWAYRYRISRYLADQKTKRTGGGKSKLQLQNKKLTTNAKVSKRKLLEFNSNTDLELENNEKSNQDIVDTVLITQEFVPKRQLLASKKADKVKVEINHDNTDDSSSDNDKVNERRRMKSYDELTDPVEIVRSYDRGLFKPRVGWQFRYRVSRYIDSLRDNIREDQERLKLGLQAIKRKTPQELSGRRKRVLDKPFTPEPEETPDVVQENKPNVGWRYRYRISKMLDAKQRGEYIDDEELKRQARLGQKTKGQDKSSATGDDDDCLEWEFDLDPELRKIGEEGKRVGWAYRYRIRRKLDELKQRQIETGVPFDWETLGGGKREKKVTPTEAATSKDSTEEKSAETNKKSVGWQYRYRVSKMLEAQKNEAADRLSKSRSKKQDQLPPHERLDPVLAQLKPEDRIVGWEYRYRIRRKLDALNNANRESGAGRRGKKSKQSADAQSKNKEKIIKQVEESIEKILNIDDIDETPFMEYFRRTSSYVLFGLVPTAKKSICLLAPPNVFVFCNDDEDVQTNTKTVNSAPKVTTPKKLKTKKEKQAKQFIQTRPTKFELAKEKIDDPVKPLSNMPTKTIEKPQRRPNNRRQTGEQIKHYDEEEHPVKKRVGVEAKKKNKKRFQIIGQEVKFKPKQTTTTTAAPSVLSTTTAPPPPPPPAPKVVLTTTTAPPPPPPTTPKPEVVPTTTTTTTTSPPLRTISEIIQEEAATLLTTPTSFIEETKEEINEANEIAQSTTATPDVNPASDNNNNDNEDADDSDSDSDSDSTDSESSTDDDDDDDGNTSDEEVNEKDAIDENFDPLSVKKMKKFYESAKESVHGVFDIKDEHNSS